MLIPMRWIQTFDATTFSVVAWPAPGATAALLVAIALIVASVFSGGLGRPRLGVLLGLGGATLAVLAGVAPGWIPLEGPPLEDQWTAAHLWHAEIRRETATSAYTLAALSLAVAVWAGARPRGGWPWVRGSLAVASLAGALLGLGHATWVRTLGPLPVLAADLPARMHVGRRLDVEVRAEGVDPTRWGRAPVSLAPTTPGTQSVTLSAWQPGVTVRREAEVEAGADRLEPRWPLAAGSRWTFAQSTTWHNHYLWFVDAPGGAEGPRLTLAVTGERVEAGLRVLDVERREGDEVTKWAAFGWNGRTVFVNEAGELEELFRVEEGPVVDGEAPCTIAPLAAWSCACVDRAPGGPLSLPGPVRCSRTEGGVVSGLASAFVALVTVGLVLEDPNRHHYLELVEATAAGSPPARPPP